jgi:RHS repeat-associated protein
VTNTQSSSATYAITRESSTNVSTTGQSHTSVTLAKNAWVDVTVTYNVGAAGPGWVKLWAEGAGAIDSGIWNVPVGHTITVTPDGQTAASRITQTGGYAESFTVTNYGGNLYTYTLTCSGSSNTSCTGVSPMQVSLGPGAQGTVIASYNVMNAGSGTLRVTAVSGAVTDSGSYTIPVNNPAAGAPIVDASPQYGNLSQNMGRCAASCFAATYAQSIVPYFSLDAPHTVTVAYHGDRLDPRPFVRVNVHADSTYGQSPSEYRLRVKVNGTFVTFLNGEGQSAKPLRFSSPTNAWVRLGGQFDATSYATGVYPMDILVTAYYAGSGDTITNTWSTKLIVVNEVGSSVARGWTVAGIQRLYMQSDSSALITEGEGSALYYAKSGSVFIKPAGEFSQLLRGQPGGASGWTRAYRDSTKVVFNSTGRMIEVRDRFNNISTVVYDGSNRVSQVKDPLNNAITLTYDANGLTSIQDPFSRVTDVVVDASKRLTTITDPDLFSTTFAYDGSLRLRAVTNRAGQVDSLTYLVINAKETNKLASVKSPAVPVFGGGSSSPVTSFEPWQIKGVPYDTTSATPYVSPRADTVYGRVIEPLGAAYVTRFTVNPWGSPAQSTDALGQSTTIVYHNTGLPWTVLRPGFGTAQDTLLYDGRGLVTYQRPAGDSATTIAYGGWAQATSVATPGRPTVSYTLGSFGMVDSVRWGGTTRAKYTYDGYGRLRRVTDALGTVVERLGYPTTGALRNQTHDTLPGNRITIYAYDTYGRDTSVTPPSGPRQVTRYNVMNWVDSVRVLTSPVTRVKRSYDRLGRDTLVTDPKDQTYKYAYNGLGWLIRQIDPAGARDTFQYNIGGELLRATNRLNQNLDFTYDPIHRLTTRAGSLTSKWIYTANSLVVTDSQPGVAIVTTYPSVLGAPDSVKTILNGSTYWQRYRYTAAGLDSTYFTGSQDASHLTVRRYRYNATTGALDSIRLGSNATSLGYDNNLSATTVDFPGSTIDTRSIGSLHSSVKSTTESANNSILERWMGFNALGQIDRHLRYTGKVGRWFAYDSLGQIRAARTRNQSPEGSLPPGCPDFDYGMSGTCTPNVDYVTLDSTAYTYDAVGNRTDQGGAYATGNRITAFASCTYETDAAGNVVSRKGTSPCVQIDTLLWTSEGWLDSLKMGSTGIKFLYDADGRLTAKRVNGIPVSWFLWDGTNVLAELSGTGDVVVTEYSYYGMDAPHAVIKQPSGQRLYARLDGLGNVLALADTGGSIQSSYAYSDWGSSSQGLDGNRARWKGALWMGPEVDVYYMRNRWYEAGTGRFLSEDPIGLAGGMNPVIFAGGDPVNGADPTGLDCYTVHGASGGAAVVCTSWWADLWVRSYDPRAYMARNVGYWDYFSRSNGMTGGGGGGAAASAAATGVARRGRTAVQDDGRESPPTWKQCMGNAAGHLGGAAKVATAAVLAAGSYAVGSQTRGDAVRIAATVGTPAAIFQAAPALEAGIYAWGGLALQATGVIIGGFLAGYFGAAAVICAFDQGSY